MRDDTASERTPAQTPRIGPSARTSSRPDECAAGTPDAGEQRHRELMNQIRVPYYEMDLRGNYTFVNHEYCDLYGTAVEGDLVGRNFKEFFGPGEVNFFRDAFSQVFLTGQPCKQEFRIKFGRSFYYGEHVVSLKRDPQGNPVGFMVITGDRTESEER